MAIELHRSSRRMVIRCPPVDEDAHDAVGHALLRSDWARGAATPVVWTSEGGVVMDLLQVAQHADDLDRAQAFYAELLGTEPLARFDPPGLLFFQLGGVRLLLDRGAPPALLYLRVADLPERVERLRAAGVVIDTEPHVIFEHEDGTLGPAGTQEWHAFVRDSEGNLVGLVEWRAATT